MVFNYIMGNLISLTLYKCLCQVLTSSLCKTSHQSMHVPWQRRSLITMSTQKRLSIRLFLPFTRFTILRKTLSFLDTSRTQPLKKVEILLLVKGNKVFSSIRAVTILQCKFKEKLISCIEKIGVRRFEFIEMEFIITSPCSTIEDPLGLK